MKKLIALILVCLICATSAYAAEWREGLSPAKPSTGSDEKDFSKSLGYLIAWPQAKFPALRFCDVLVMYMPRDDVALGEGKITLCDSDGEIATMDCADPMQVELKPLEESELEAMMWGSGSYLMAHLPISLEFGKTDYYVMMDEGVLYDPANGVKSPAMPKNSNWHPLLQDDFGVSRLYYAKGKAEEADEDEDDGKAAEVEYTYRPEAGDTVTFDLVLGGDAKEAVITSENNSMYFSLYQFNESCTVTGTVVTDDVNWKIIFLGEPDEEGKVPVLDQLTFRKRTNAEAAGAEN